MDLEKRDDFLIIVSTIVAILCSKVADFTLPVFIVHKFINVPQVDPWIGLILNILLLIAIALVILRFVKWATKKAMDNS
jgi:hypothetical protein